MPFILLAAVLAALVVLTGAVYAYAEAQRDKIAEGVQVGGVSVGGLTRAEAVRRLEARLVAGLKREIVVHHDTSTWTLGPREARIAADVEGSVDRALSRSREGSFLERALRSLTGGKIEENLEPEVTYSKAAVVRMLDKIRKGVDRKPKDASIKLSASGITKVEGRRGLAVRASELHAQIRKAITSPTADRRFVAQTRKVQPKVTTEKLERKFGTALVVNRGAFKLQLYKRLKLVKTYPIAVGQAGLETPAGTYTIANKAVNPAWHVPNSDWAGDLAGKVIPGGVPENPIRARWLGVYDGVGIHGTTARGSIGTNASHGCIRMLEEDVIELYDDVPVGAPIHIA
jgi:lipoprotein-anchoring transpeptidase ErfK/SrfK